MRKRRAIIFDDSESVLSFFRDYFFFRDYEVLALREPVVCPIYANNGRQCSQPHPCADIVITDYRMPRMTGAELLKEQLQRGCKLVPHNKALLSGYIEPAVVDSVTVLGFAFFRKPVLIAQFSAWVSSCEHRMDLAQPLADRRHESRDEVSRPEWYQLDRETTAIACQILNTSAQGLCLQTPAPLYATQRVYITSSAGELTEARVCWSRKHDDGWYRSGLKCS